MQISGVAIFQDCPSLDRYNLVPKPANFYSKHGVHPKVCCPQYLSPDTVCTPSDPWCPNYVVRRWTILSLEMKNKIFFRSLWRDHRDSGQWTTR